MIFCHKISITFGSTFCYSFFYITMSAETAITTGTGQEKRQTKRQRKAEAFRKGESRKKARNDLGEPVSTTPVDDEVVAPDLRQLVADSGNIFKLDSLVDTDRTLNKKKKTKEPAKSKAKSKNIAQNNGTVVGTDIKIPTPIATPTTTATKPNNGNNNDGDKKRRYIVFVGKLILVKYDK
jgi:hypothetical protein